MNLQRSVKIHDSTGFARARQAGHLAAATLDYIAPYVTPGITTGELDDICHNYIKKNGAIAAPLGYRGFPKANCISVNHVVCHGIPSSEKYLQDGDILNIDVTVKLDGWHGDSSRMYIAGRAGTKARKLCDITYDCLMAGIAQVKPGAYVGDIGHAIQTLAESKNYSVVREFTGHGIGEIFHDDPYIFHYGVRGSGMQLVPGMIFTIEPMINAGKPDVKVLQDNWTAVTRDRSLSAQFEHMIGVTDSGCEIFTLSPTGLHKPYSSTQ
jgi:methionyl aminopeptidase